MIKRTVRLSETDATGAIYFAEALKYATEAFEELLIQSGGDMRTSEFLLPIVSCSSSYKIPLLLGDEIEIDLSLGRIGKSSFVLETKIFKQGKEASRVSITHAVTARSTMRTFGEVPAPLRCILNQLRTESCNLVVNP